MSKYKDSVYAYDCGFLEGLGKALEICKSLEENTEIDYIDLINKIIQKRYEKLDEIKNSLKVANND
ncbi:MAG: hypothetical protein LBB59_00975 [Campylobacteraceae bacterium]|jgi:hypothetical protein|nr:hypothetical protein [Campylobacteraceae bacterium]